MTPLRLALTLASTTLLLLALAPPVQGEDPAPPPDRSVRFFRAYDANGDGRLSLEEYPAFLRAFFAEVDANRDGFVTREEDAAYRRRPAAKETPRGRGRLPDTVHADLVYGTHARNVLDLWVAKGDGPHPLVVYFHGGGFRAGDKRTLNPALLQGLLDAGISVAAANYRLTDAAPFPAPMRDAARAVQWLRRHAETYAIDPARIGATGGSAGAGISLWLGYHDDLADPASEDEVLRQSSRVQAMVVYAAQSSYDPRFIQKLFGTTNIHGALVPFYGLSSPEEVADPRFFPLFEEASPIHHLTPGDAPAFLYYPQANTPLEPGSPGGSHIHHPKFGLVLKERCDALGVGCTVRLREETGGRTPTDEYVAFFQKHLGTP